MRFEVFGSEPFRTPKLKIKSSSDLRTYKTQLMRIILCKGQIYGPISGSDETLVTYATQLQNAGHSVVVLLMYLHAGENQYYQRLLEAGVPVSWVASKLAGTSMGAGRKLVSKVHHTFPRSRQFVR